MRKVVPKTSFLGGEAGFLLQGRSDLAQFQLGCRRLQNFFAMKGGGITRRPGTRYVKNTQGDITARLIPFVFSYDSGVDIYVIEITQPTAGYLYFKVIRVSDNAVFTVIGDIPFLVGRDTTGSGVYATIDLTQIHYQQSADYIFMTNADMVPIMLSRVTTTPTFLFESYFLDAGTVSGAKYSLPYRDVNVTGITITISAIVGNSCTLTASSSLFNILQVGTIFRIDDGGATACYVRLGALTSATVAGGSFYSDPTHSTGAATTNWNEGAWSNYRGFPRTVCLYNSRLMFGGNTSQRDTVWGSKVSNYFQMYDDPTTVSSADPVIFTLNSENLNQVRWMTGGKSLTIGTTSSEWVGTISNQGTDLLVQFDQETTHGGAPIQPRRSAYTVPFVQRSGKTVREIVFDFYSNTYQATDLNIFSSHIGSPSGVFDSKNTYNVYLQGMAYQESPFNILYVWDSVGRLYGLTRDKQQQIAAWHSHVFGVTAYQAALTGAAALSAVVSACSVPSVDGKSDRLWLVVKRNVNGSTKYHIEYIDDIKPGKDLWLGSNIAANGDVQDIRSFLDCATYDTTGLADVSNKTAWGAYTRFASDTAYVVAALQDGTIVYNGLIAVNGSGNLTLPVAAQQIVIGLHANAEVRLLPLEGNSDGAPLNLKSTKRIDGATIRVHETYGLMVGKDRILGKGGYSDNTTFESIIFDTTQFGLLPTFTGPKEILIPTSAETDGSFALVMQQPWPCTILAISSRVVSNEV